MVVRVHPGSIFDGYVGRHGNSCGLNFCRHCFQAPRPARRSEASDPGSTPPLCRQDKSLSAGKMSHDDPGAEESPSRTISQPQPSRPRPWGTFNYYSVIFAQQRNRSTCPCLPTNIDPGCLQPQRWHPSTTATPYPLGHWICAVTCLFQVDTEGIRTPAGRAQWISSPSP